MTRHVFLRRKFGEAWTVYGGIPGAAYRLALTMLAMGGANAPSFAQSVHLGVLWRAAYPDDKCLEFGNPFVDRDLLVGIVLDDVLVLADDATAGAGKLNLADPNLAKKFPEVYGQVNLAFPEKKCFGWFQPGATKGVFYFASWGARVHSWSGRAGNPIYLIK